MAALTVTWSMPEWESTFTWEPGHCAQTDNAGAAKCEASKLSLTQTASLPQPVYLSPLSSHFIHGPHKNQTSTQARTRSHHINTHTQNTLHQSPDIADRQKGEGGRKERGGKETESEREEWVPDIQQLILFMSLHQLKHREDRQRDGYRKGSQEWEDREEKPRHETVKEREKLWDSGELKCPHSLSDGA